jgi:hypothetical protein
VEYAALHAERTQKGEHMSPLKESILEEVSRLRGEIQQIDKVIAPHLKRKQQFEQQLCALEGYLKASTEAPGEHIQDALLINISDSGWPKRRVLTDIAFDTLKRLGRKVYIKELLVEIEKDGQYKVPGKNPTRNLQTVLWRDSNRVIHYGRQVYGLREWERAVS